MILSILAFSCKNIYPCIFVITLLEYFYYWVFQKLSKWLKFLYEKVNRLAKNHKGGGDDDHDELKKLDEIQEIKRQIQEELSYINEFSDNFNIGRDN